jgi:uncharacterized protein YxeA
MKKYLKNILSLAVLLVTGMFACTSDSRNHEAHQQAQEKKKAVRLTAEEVEASGPYLTYDQEKKPVLCWTEKINDQKGYILKYAVLTLPRKRLENLLAYCLPWVQDHILKV